MLTHSVISVCKVFIKSLYCLSLVSDVSEVKDFKDCTNLWVILSHLLRTVIAAASLEIICSNCLHMHRLMLRTNWRDKQLLKKKRRSFWVSLSENGRALCQQAFLQTVYSYLLQTGLQSQTESQSPTKGYNVFIVATPSAPTMRSTDEKWLLLPGLWVETLIDPLNHKDWF